MGDGTDTPADEEPDASWPTGQSDESLSVPLGQSLARYVVFEEIGRGAMGRVLRAYDPKLEREVALKLLRSDVLDADAQARLVREARAMAKLSHPNVVAVYDVEDTSSGLVLVMEHVRGQTLRAWLSKRKRSWGELMERFLEAGRGLAAAHAEDLLHRDFKPGNVLVPAEGVAKVTDFGLAKPMARVDSEPLRPSSDLRRSLSPTLTQDGMAIGTPLYMAPEQHHGGATDATADQFAFCVAIWEALTGQPPYRGRSHDLAVRKRRGPPPWPDDVAVPRPVVRALRRGLAVEPASRWPSMNALLDALAYDPARRRRRVVMGGAALGFLGLGTVAAQGWVERRAARCTGASAQLQGIWDDERRAEVEAAIHGAYAHVAPDVWARIAPRLDTYAEDWTIMHTEACEATTVRGEQSVLVMDLRMGCLHRARMELQAATEVLASADDDVVLRAHRVVDGLRSLDRCADVDALQADVEPPSLDDATGVRDIRQALLRSEALRKAGRYDQARQSVDRARGLLTQVGYEPIRTDVELERGHVFERLADWEASEAAFRAAIGHGARFGQWAQIQESAAKLLYVIGDERARPEQALRYRELAMGLARGDEARAHVHNNLGNLRQAQGKYSEAEEHHRRALALRLEALGPRHLDVAASRNNIAATVHAQGNMAEAEAELRQALAIRQDRLGPRHPDVALTINNLGISLHEQGKLVDAEAEFRHVLELRLEVLGPEHLSVMDSYNSVGIALYEQGKYVDAEAQFRLALKGKQAQLDPKHPELANLRSNVASALSAQGKYVEAEAEHRRILAHQQEVLDPGHPYISNTHANLGNALNAQGKHVLAEAEYREALAMRQAALGPEHRKTADMHDSLGGALHAQDRNEDAEVELRKAVELRQALYGADDSDLATSRMRLATALLGQGKERVGEALPLAELAWERLQRDDIRTAKRADAAFTAARARWASGGDRAETRALGRRALALYEEIDEQDNAAEVRAWLRQ